MRWPFRGRSTSPCRATVGPSPWGRKASCTSTGTSRERSTERPAPPSTPRGRRGSGALSLRRQAQYRAGAHAGGIAGHPLCKAGLLPASAHVVDPLAGVTARVARLEHDGVGDGASPRGARHVVEGATAADAAETGGSVLAGRSQA